MKTESFEESNTELFKEQLDSRNRSLRAIFKTCLKEMERSEIIQILKEKKYIEQDFEQKGNKFVERKE